MRPVSYSGMSTYEQCPSKFKRRYITQEPVPEQGEIRSPAAERGTKIHRNIELFLKGKSDDLVEEVEFYRDFFTALREKPHLQPEWQFALSKDWDTTSFTDMEAVLRGIVDCTVFDPQDEVVHVYEFKTGKEYVEHEQQRALYGLAGLCAYPNAKEALVYTMYLDQKSHKNSVFDGESRKAYQWFWTHKLNKIWTDPEYPEQPSWKCKRCPYSKRVGGKCEN